MKWDLIEIIISNWNLITHTHTVQALHTHTKKLMNNSHWVDWIYRFKWNRERESACKTIRAQNYKLFKCIRKIETNRKPVVYFSCL